MATAIWLKTQEYMQNPTCSEEELQARDRVIERVISTWKQWWRISEGLL